jgi:hypothetical protein
MIARGAMITMQPASGLRVCISHFTRRVRRPRAPSALPKGIRENGFGFLRMTTTENILID